MTAIAESWGKQADGNAFMRFVDITLRGSGQVMFQNNPLTGLLFLIGIFWGSYAAGSIQVGIGALLALIVATLMAYVMEADTDALRSGLYGFNGILVGASLGTFLDPTPMMWAYIVIGSAVSTVAMIAIASVFKTWNTPALTFPFVLTTWFLLLASYAFSSLDLTLLPAPALPVDTTGAALVLDPMTLATALLNGISQVFLIQNAITGIIFIVALGVSSWRAALFAVIGSAIALAASVILGANGTGVAAGLFGFSAVLTAIALGATFYPYSPRMLFVTIVAVIFTVIVQGALDTTVTPFGIPTFTAPFVFVTWIFLLPHLKFAPVLHRELVHPSQQKPAPVAHAPLTAPAATAKPSGKGSA